MSVAMIRLPEILAHVHGKIFSGLIYNSCRLLNRQSWCDPNCQNCSQPVWHVRVRQWNPWHPRTCESSPQCKIWMKPFWQPAKQRQIKIFWSGKIYILCSSFVCCLLTELHLLGPTSTVPVQKRKQRLGLKWLCTWVNRRLFIKKELKSCLKQ